MYSEHFGFKVNPFSVTASPQFCYESPTFKIVCDGLVDHIQNKQDIVLLTGEPGVGKTYLLNEFKRRIGSQFHCVYPPEATNNFGDIVDCLCNELIFEAPDKSFLAKMKLLTSVKMRLLDDFLSVNKHSNTHTILIIDDAHRLHEESLKALSLIATPASEHNGSVHILLSGLPKLEEKLHRAIPDQTEQIKAVHSKINRLGSSDVDGFIKHRLQIANYYGDGLFTTDAISRVAAYSNGIPRVILHLCRLALLTASLEEKQIVSAETISKSALYCLAETDEKVIDLKSSDTFERQSTEGLTRPRKRPSLSTPLVWGAGLVAISGLVYQMSGVVSGMNPKQLSAEAPEAESVIAQTGPGAADPSLGDEITQPVVDMASFSNVKSGESQTPQPAASDPALSPAGDSRQMLAVALQQATPSEAPDAGLTDSAAGPAKANAAQPGDNARRLISTLEDPDLDRLYRQADRLGKHGQSTDAYLLYFYAAKRGHGEAAFKLAQLADPATFKPDIGLRDTPSLAQANKWYQQALAAGHAQARQAVTLLYAQVAQRAARGDEPAQRLMLHIDTTQDAQ